MPKNTFETGVDGTVMTTANTTAGGDAATFIISNNVAASGNLAYEADAAHYGSMGCRITLAAATSYWRWDVTQATGRWVWSRTFKVLSTPTATSIVLGGIYAAGVVMAQIRLMASPANVLRVANATADITASDSPALTVGNKYYVELAVTEGTTTSNGKIEISLWDVSTGTVIHTWSSTAQNTGTVGASRSRHGGAITGSGWTIDDMDQIEFKQLASGWIGPPVIATEPEFNDWVWCSPGVWK